jgi:hypothetical protein
MGQAKALTPEDAVSRGRSLLDRGEYAAAVEAYSSAIQRDATLSDAFYGRGMASGIVVLRCMKKEQGRTRYLIYLKLSN